MVNWHGSDVWRVGSQDTASVNLHTMSRCRVGPQSGGAAYGHSALTWQMPVPSPRGSPCCARPPPAALSAEEQVQAGSWWELETSNGPPGQMTDSESSSNQLHGSRLHVAADPHRTVQSTVAEDVLAGLLQESRHLDNWGPVSWHSRELLFIEGSS